MPGTLHELQSVSGCKTLLIRLYVAMYLLENRVTHILKAQNKGLSNIPNFYKSPKDITC